MISLKNTLEAIGNKISAITSQINTMVSPFPDYSRLLQSYAFASATQTWTATEDCVLFISGCIQAGVEGFCHIKVNNVMVYDYRSGGACRHSITGTVYARKNDVIEMYAWSNSQVLFKIFGLQNMGGYYVVSSIARRLGVLYDFVKEHINRYCDKVERHFHRLKLHYHRQLGNMLGKYNKRCENQLPNNIHFKSIYIYARTSHTKFCEYVLARLQHISSNNYILSCFSKILRTRPLIWRCGRKCILACHWQCLSESESGVVL